MSFFDDASLVMIPSGYKDQKVYSVKPLDGTGDLTFTRSNDTATRVNSSGLIERVRTNRIIQSQDFSTAWSAISCTVATNTTANPLNGAVDADTITFTGGTTQKYVIQEFSFNGVYTVSVYLKAGTNQFVQFLLGSDAGVYGNFDLVNGTSGSVTGSTATMVSLGNGWYRCTMSFTSTTGTHVFIQAVDSLSASRFATTTSTGTLIAFGYQLEVGDIATAYIATTSAAVSVGPVANLPRLDYSGGATCPSLLLEPQRTNSVTYSEQFNNSDWLKAETTVTANAIISPDGSTNADKVEATNTIGCYVNQSNTFTGTYTHSVYAKAGNVSSFTILWASYTSGKGATFNLSNGTATTVGSTVTATITNVGNGWYRCTTTDTSANYIYLVSLNNPNNSPIASGSYIYLWGAQIEAGAYATSYIPTIAATTRGADSCSKTGIGSLLSASEYTLYWEGTHIPTSQYNSFMTVYKSTDENSSARFYRSNTNNEIRAAIFNSVNGLILDLGSEVTTQTAKCAFRVKAGDYAFYVNGTLAASTTNALAPASTLDVVNLQYLNNSQSFDQKTAQVLFFKTGLTNAQLAELTTL
jgi:hypothetical protein